MNLENYQIIFLKDYSNNKISGIILLNKKHTIKEFQEELDKAKEKAFNDILLNGDDWFYIQENVNKNFDYYELPIDENNCVVF